jgi:hypothetical protein
MAPGFAARVFASAATVLFAAAALAQETKTPQMTPEQMAEMEAYIKAGTPGAPHQALASTAGTYDCKVRSWHEQVDLRWRGGIRARWLDGRVLIEDSPGR